MARLKEIPEIFSFEYVEFYTLAGNENGEYVGIKRLGLLDYDRQVYYEDSEADDNIDGMWTAYDVGAGVTICKAEDFDGLYQKISDMWETIESMRKTDKYKDLEDLYNKVIMDKYY